MTSERRIVSPRRIRTLGTNEKISIGHPLQALPYAGAEFLGLSTCKILQEMGFHVSILSDVFEPSRAEEIYGMGDVLGRCTQIRLPEPTLHPPFRLDYLTRILYVIRLARLSRVLDQKDFQLIFSTQSSIFS